MAKLKLASCTTKSKNYKNYKNYLKTQYKNSCGYCFIRNTYFEIDHYEPQNYAIERINDPSNLVLSCRMCNSIKSDYHPLHYNRKSLIQDTSRYFIHDIVNEDILETLSVDEAGCILTSSSRGRWLIALFNLNDPNYVEIRRNAIEAVQFLNESKGNNDQDIQKAIKLISKMLHSDILFLNLFEKKLL